MKNEKYSLKDFSGQKFVNEPKEDFGGEIIGACFYQENAPETEVFPSDITTMFIRCNLDNVKLPLGCTLEDCTNKRIKVGEDGYDWIVNENLQPIERL